MADLQGGGAVGPGRAEGGGYDETETEVATRDEVGEETGLGKSRSLRTERLWQRPTSKITKRTWRNRLVRDLICPVLRTLHRFGIPRAGHWRH